MNRLALTILSIPAGCIAFLGCITDGDVTTPVAPLNSKAQGVILDGEKDDIAQFIETTIEIPTNRSCFVGILTYKHPYGLGPFGPVEGKDEEAGLTRPADYHFYLLYPKSRFGESYFIEDCGRMGDGDLFGEIGSVYLGEPFRPMLSQNEPVHHCTCRPTDITRHLRENLPDPEVIEKLSGQKLRTLERAQN